MATGRDAALDALTACRRLDAWSDGSLKAVSRGLEPREAALAARLAYGVLQNRALLDYYLGCFCAQPFQKLEPFVRDVLRLGAYQVLFMDRVPDSAAVDQAVEMVKRRKHQRSSGMVNAVLRRLSREKDHLPALPEGTAQERLSLQYSHPAWLTGRLLDLLGPEEAEAFLRLDNGSVPTAIQRNPLRCTPEELTASLEAAGARLTPHPLLPDCWYMTGGGDVQAMEAFQKGFSRSRTLRQRRRSWRRGPGPGTGCWTAPGGKTFAAAMAMEEKGELVACDIQPHKMALIEKGAARLGLTCVSAVRADGKINREEWNERFDLVLCDVPCSGLGIIRKKPDIRYKDPAALSGLPAVQRAILDNAARYVKPGGTLLYATCTVLPEENGDVTEGFLSEHPGFGKAPFVLTGLGLETDGSVTLWPQRQGTDGFYICKMRKL